MVFRKRNYRRKAANKRKAVPKRKSMVKLIKSVISKQAEKKQADYTNELTPFAWGGNGFNTQNILPVSPYTSFLQIAQGATAAGRIGNKIRTKKLMMKFICTPMPYNQSSNTLPKPQEVTLYFIKSKDTPVSLTSSSGLGNFFQSSSGSSAPSGTIYDQLKQVNTDLFTVCHKLKFKVGAAYYSGTGYSGENQYFANNDFKLNVVRTVDLTKHCPSVVQYNDNNTTPTSPTLQMLLFASNADGTGYNTGAQQQLKFFYQLYYEYEDM